MFSSSSPDKKSQSNQAQSVPIHHSFVNQEPMVSALFKGEGKIIIHSPQKQRRRRREAPKVDQDLEEIDALIVKQAAKHQQSQSESKNRPNRLLLQENDDDDDEDD